MENEPRDASLRAAADTLAENLPAEQRESFKDDYVEVMTKLNEVVDERLANMSRDALELIHMYIPHRPAEANTLIEGYTSMVRKLATAAMNVNSSIANHAIRAVVAAAITDVMDSCAKAVMEIAVRSERNQKVRSD